MNTLKMTSTVLILFILSSFANNKEDQLNFLKKYQDFCGYSYSGQTTIVDIASGELFAEAELIMTVSECDDNIVRIPFHVGEDKSRTWILQMKEQGLHLSHDHRYEDGTEHADNFYGGFADRRGTESVHFFPADDKTIADRPGRSINTWSKEIDLSAQKYYYRLYLQDELRFEVVFDLSNPLSF